jgi:hypothetical protein
MERLSQLMEKAEPILLTDPPAEPSETIPSPEPVNVEGVPPAAKKHSKTKEDLTQDG